VIKKFTKETMIRLAMVLGWYVCVWGVAVGIFIGGFWVIVIVAAVAMVLSAFLDWRKQRD